MMKVPFIIRQQSEYDSTKYYLMILSEIDFIMNFVISVISDASHGKLLLQAEEAIYTRLNDAEQKVKTIQKVTSFSYSLNK